MATPRDALAVGDTVYIGRAKVGWIIVGFHTLSDGQERAELKSNVGYANTVAVVERLTIAAGAR